MTLDGAAVLKGYSELSETDKAYIAALIDGEGCILIQKTRPNGAECSPKYTLCVTVGITYEPTVRYLHNVFGGTYASKRIRVPGWKPQWVWRVSGARAVECLEVVYPYLKEKREQAWLGLEYSKQLTLTKTMKLGVPSEELALREGYYLALQWAKT